MTDDATALKTTAPQVWNSDCSESATVSAKPHDGAAGNAGNDPHRSFTTSVVHEDMAVTSADVSDRDARAVTRNTTVDLSTISDSFPSKTNLELVFRGTPGSYVIEAALPNGTRYTIEGGGRSAELTGVFVPNGTAEKPASVPGWLEAVLIERTPIHEVSCY